MTPAPLPAERLRSSRPRTSPSPSGTSSDRLRSHRLTTPAATVADAAAHMLAVQSQDFLAGRWALGVRTRGEPTLATVDAAFARGELVRGWTMRGTLHIVPARDLAWILSVTAERQRRQAAARHRQLGIDEAMLAVAERAIRPALGDGGLARAEIFALWERAGIDPRAQRGVHLLAALTFAGVLCQGPVAARNGGVSRDQRFVLVEEWVRDPYTPDDPLAELFVRYIRGHGPAGAADFAWWSGLPLGTAREAAERAGARLTEVEDGVFLARPRPRRSLPDAATFALPAFDEYYISYADRTAVCAPERLDDIGPGKNGMVRPVLVAGGRVVGTWSAAGGAELFDADADAEAADRGAASAVARFASFVGSEPAPR
ncbi:winged helix DNA-binding domain-containing protein [Microbacterium neungamense]|uniref:winged helix DNA-binding domain-containing protein n=1 Tax=Microbacterium neungamense TaxID=2810535 RepID=UPI00217DC3E5|nr:winged helix DNA-binding domain-containing protein [Microbacterium neungamense]UWF78013.1 AlkZ family DNA glycosylase [Microbacterium neungamense]